LPEAAKLPGGSVIMLGKLKLKFSATGKAKFYQVGIKLASEMNL
jgi:hypothetical protein